MASDYLCKKDMHEAGKSGLLPQVLCLPEELLGIPLYMLASHGSKWPLGQFSVVEKERGHREQEVISSRKRKQDPSASRVSDIC